MVVSERRKGERKRKLTLAPPAAARRMTSVHTEMFLAIEGVLHICATAANMFIFIDKGRGSTNSRFNRFKDSTDSKRLKIQPIQPTQPTQRFKRFKRSNRFRTEGSLYRSSDF